MRELRQRPRYSCGAILARLPGEIRVRRRPGLAQALWRTAAEPAAAAIICRRVSFFMSSAPNTSGPSASRAAASMAARGAVSPVQISNCRTACSMNILTPGITCLPCARARRISSFRADYKPGRKRSRRESRFRKQQSFTFGHMPTGVALMTTSKCRAQALLERQVLRDQAGERAHAVGDCAR